MQLSIPFLFPYLICQAAAAGEGCPVKADHGMAEILDSYKPGEDKDAVAGRNPPRQKPEHMMEILEQPEIGDYYADLGGLPQSATAGDIKSAWFTLAKQHHPDKKAPGKPIDAEEFRRIREAYDCLRDPSSRLKYDTQYLKIKTQWTQYRAFLARRRKLEAQKRAEATATAAAARAKAEAEALLKLQARLEKERLAEERSREAGRRLRLQHQKEARDRLRFEQLEQEREKREEEEAALRKQKIEAARLRKEAAALKQKEEEETRKQLWQKELAKREADFDETRWRIQPQLEAQKELAKEKKKEKEREKAARSKAKIVADDDGNDSDSEDLGHSPEEEAQTQLWQKELEKREKEYEKAKARIAMEAAESRLAKQKEEERQAKIATRKIRDAAQRRATRAFKNNTEIDVVICEHPQKLGWTVQIGVDMCSRCDVVQKRVHQCPLCHASFCAGCKTIHFANL